MSHDIRIFQVFPNITLKNFNNTTDHKSSTQNSCAKVQFSGWNKHSNYIDFNKDLPPLSTSAFFSRKKGSRPEKIYAKIFAIIFISM